jgi:HSP20 family protein
MNAKTMVPNPKVETMPAVREPVGLFDVLEREMNDLFSNPWPLLMRPLASLERRTAGWVPRLDAFEKDGELLVHVDLPGLDKKDIHVELDENELVIRGERKIETKIEDKDCYRMERVYGNFVRRLPLGFVPDPGLIVANFKNGVLEVKVPIPIAERRELKKISVT